jgi:hypothetical protein
MSKLDFSDSESAMLTVDGKYFYLSDIEVSPIIVAKLDACFRIDK